MTIEFGIHCLSRIFESAEFLFRYVIFPPQTVVEDLFSKPPLEVKQTPQLAYLLCLLAKFTLCYHTTTPSLARPATVSVPIADDTTTKVMIDKRAELRAEGFTFRRVWKWWQSLFLYRKISFLI